MSQPAAAEIPVNGHAPSVDELNRNGRRIEELIQKIENLPDLPARTLMHECLEALMGFYGAGLARMLQVVKRAGIDGQKIHDQLVEDRVVSSLLLIHGLHPLDLETRLRRAIEKVRPYMQSHGGNVEILSLENEFARLRLQGTCKTCPSSSVTLELAVRHAIEEACPDLQGFEVEGVETAEPHAKATAEWVVVDGASGLAEGGLVRVTTKGAPLLLCKAGGQFYAYRDRCPACNMPLHLGTLQAGVLACRAGHRFSVRDAGISPDDAALHLEPVPLISKDGALQAAIAEDQPG